MKKYLISSIISALILAGCDSGTSNNVGNVPPPPNPPAPQTASVIANDKLMADKLVEQGITYVLPSLETSQTDYQSAVSYGYAYAGHLMSRVDVNCFDSEDELAKNRNEFEQFASQQYPSQESFAIGYPQGSVLITSLDTYQGEPRMSSVYMPVRHGDSYCAVEIPNSIIKN